jgi:hypothetical protein
VIDAVETTAPVRAAYCTIINASFAPRALALQRSIAKRSPDAWFAFYCVDDATAALLRRHAGPHVLVIPPAAYESAPLRAAKARLRLNEYCWTCKPAILLHALKTMPELQWAVWLDSDMLAFGDLDEELRRHPEASAVLTPHRFSLPEFAAYEPAVGRFNAGYAAFHNTAEGLAALRWWMDRCLEGCPAVPADGRYADQKYLDEVPRLFTDVVASDSVGLNCAPWNLFEKRIDRAGNGVTVGGTPLLLYHFQGLKIIRDWAFDLYGARRRLPSAARKIIYAPYLRALASQIRAVATDSREPWAGIDRDFVGHLGLLRAAKRLLWSTNLVVRFAPASGGDRD